MYNNLLFDSYLIYMQFQVLKLENMYNLRVKNLLINPFYNLNAGILLNTFELRLIKFYRMECS